MAFHCSVFCRLSVYVKIFNHLERFLRKTLGLIQCRNEYRTLRWADGLLLPSTHRRGGGGGGGRRRRRERRWCAGGVAWNTDAPAGLGTHGHRRRQNVMTRPATRDWPWVFTPGGPSLRDGAKVGCFFRRSHRRGVRRCGRNRPK